MFAAKATFDAISKTYSYLTPDLWKETQFTKAPYQVTFLQSIDPSDHGWFCINWKGTQSSVYPRHSMPDSQEHIEPNTFLKYHAIQYDIVFGPLSQW